MKLLFVVGATKHFVSHYLALAQAAQRCGYEIHVAAPEDEVTETLGNLHFIYHPISLLRKNINPFTEIKSVISLLRLYRKLKPDLIQQFTIKPIIYGGIAAKIAKIPAIISVVTGRGYVFVADGFKPRMLQAIVKPLYRLALKHHNSRVIFQNHMDQEYFQKNRLVSSDKTILIPGAGIDLIQFHSLPEPEGKITIVLAARMLRDKGVYEFVEAATLMQKNNSNARMILVGAPDPNNPSSITLEQLQHWENSKIIEYWGWQENMQDVFAKSHIICLPSYGEGMPRVLLEAAACGRAIVTTDVAGCNEIIQHEVNGLLVPQKDPIALARAINQLVNDKNLRQQLGLQARKCVEQKYSLNLIIEQNLKLYKELNNHIMS